MRAAAAALLRDVVPPEREQKLLLKRVHRLGRQNERLVLQHGRHVETVDRHLKEKKPSVGQRVTQLLVPIKMVPI